jgi:hypothetical protein
MYEISFSNGIRVFLIQFNQEFLYKNVRMKFKMAGRSSIGLPRDFILRIVHDLDA